MEIKNKRDSIGEFIVFFDLYFVIYIYLYI